jgi:hypothetical protein
MHLAPAAVTAPASTLTLPTLKHALSTLELPATRRAAMGLFLRHLALGERVAQHSAARQARLAPTARAARFFRAQARHEALHARVFDFAAASLGTVVPALAPCPYCAYDAQLAGAALRGDYADTVVGTQLVLEALGEILLERLDAGLERHGTGLHRLRRLLRAQEAAHHAFGVAEIAALAAATPGGMAALRTRIPPYRALAQAMIEAASPVLHVFELAPADIGHELDACLDTGCAP